MEDVQPEPQTHVVGHTLLPPVVARHRHSPTLPVCLSFFDRRPLLRQQLIIASYRQRKIRSVGGGRSPQGGLSNYKNSSRIFQSLLRGPGHVHTGSRRGRVQDRGRSRSRLEGGHLASYGRSCRRAGLVRSSRALGSHTVAQPPLQPRGKRVVNRLDSK